MAALMLLFRILLVWIIYNRSYWTVRTMSVYVVGQSPSNHMIAGYFRANIFRSLKCSHHVFETGAVDERRESGRSTVLIRPHPVLTGRAA
jgi:hypothetical protein